MDIKEKVEAIIEEIKKNPNIKEDFEKEPVEEDLSYNVERMQHFAAFFPKNQYCRLQFRYQGIFGKVSILNNEWYCYTLGARLSKRRA